MKKIAIVFAIVGLVVGVAYASVEDLEKAIAERETSMSKEEKLARIRKNLDKLSDSYGVDGSSEEKQIDKASLKEIFKKEYREEAEIIKIMSEARAEVDAKFQEQTEQTTNYLEEKTTTESLSIPDVIWAAIIASGIASGITLLGVGLSNRANRKCLLVQLNHAAKEKDKERKMQFLKDIYVEAAKAIAEAIQDIQFLPNRIVHSNNLEICKKLLPALAKIHMVGTLDTIKNTLQFMGKFNQSTLPIVPEISKFANLKQEIATLNEISKIQINTMNQTNRNFEQMDNSSKQLSLDIYQKMIEKTATGHEATIKSMEDKESELKKLHVKLLSMCLESGTYLQKEALNVLLSIRKELDFEIDSAEYLSKINEAFNAYGDSLSQDNIEKLIHPKPESDKTSMGT